MKNTFLFLVLILLHQQGFAQSPRQCGCKTFRQWTEENSESKKESRKNRKQVYNTYLVDCLRKCRERAGEEKGGLK